MVTKQNFKTNLKFIYFNRAKYSLISPCAFCPIDGGESRARFPSASGTLRNDKFAPPGPLPQRGSRSLRAGPTTVGEYSESYRCHNCTLVRCEVQQGRHVCYLCACEVVRVLLEKGEEDACGHGERQKLVEEGEGHAREGETGQLVDEKQGRGAQQQDGREPGQNAVGAECGGVGRRDRRQAGQGETAVGVEAGVEAGAEAEEQQETTEGRQTRSLIF